MEKILKLKNGPTLTVRVPTGLEIYQIADKQTKASQSDSIRHLDDGRQEIYQFITSPSRADLDAFIQKKPLLYRVLFEKIKTWVGDRVEIKRVDLDLSVDVVDLTQPNDVLCFLIEEKRIKVQCFGELVLALIQRKSGDELYGTIVSNTKEHVLPESRADLAELEAKYPIIVYLLGGQIVQNAAPEFEEEVIPQVILGK